MSDDPSELFEIRNDDRPHRLKRIMLYIRPESPGALFSVVMFKDPILPPTEEAHLANSSLILSAKRLKLRTGIHDVVQGTLELDSVRIMDTEAGEYSLVDLEKPAK